MLLHVGIAPHLLQPVEPAGLRKEDVHYHIDEIDNDPLQGSISFVVKRLLTARFPDGFPYMVCNGLDLGGRSGLTDDEKIGHGFRYPVEVHGDQIFTLLVLYGLDDDLEDPAAPCGTADFLGCSLHFWN